MASRRRIAKWFWALTPVALRAPSVSAQNQRPAKEKTFPANYDKEYPRRS